MLNRSDYSLFLLKNTQHGKAAQYNWTAPKQMSYYESIDDIQ